MLEKQITVNLVEVIANAAVQVRVKTAIVEAAKPVALEE
jgi:hypothetical protein